MPNPKSVTDDELLDAVDAALEETDRDRVTANEVAEHCRLAKTTVQGRLPDLADGDRLVKTASLLNPVANAYQLPGEDGDGR